MSGAPASSHVAPASSSRLRRWQGGFRCRKDWIWRRWRSDRGGRHGPPTWAATEVASFSTVARRERSHPTPRPSSSAMTRPCRPTPLLCIRVPHKRRRSRARARAPDSCSRPFFPGRRGVRFSYSRHGAHPVFVKQPLVLAEWVVNLLLVLNCAQQGIYRNNGYLMVSCNGGLNQMRVAICDMVVPELDKTSFWNDPSEFQDIFDVKHFITSFQDKVPIQRELPPRVKRRVELGMFHSMPPISWSDISYYHNQILPLIQKHKVLHLNRTDARLANNGLPMEIQKLRCRVNYASLRFTVEIEDLGKRVIRILGQNGPFLVLHLRYEKDMLAFLGCTQGCSNEEAGELTRMRCAYPWWKEKIIDWDLKRKDGLCPLTPEETALVLRALDIDRSMQIYIAAVEIYGGKSRMAALTSAYPYVVRKDTLLEPSNLMYFQNHSSQMAALIYMVSCCFTCCTNTARLWCVEILIAILKGYIDLISDVCKNCIKKCCIMACGAMYT